jgi:hypothetical protein
VTGWTDNAVTTESGSDFLSTAGLVDHSIRRLDTFNSRAVHYYGRMRRSLEGSARLLFGGGAYQLFPDVQPLVDAFAQADTQALFFSRRNWRRHTFAAWLPIVALSVFDIYSHAAPEAYWMLALYAFVLALFGLITSTDESVARQDQIEYRFLAEALRMHYTMADYATLLRDHITLTCRSIDRLFLQAYVPKLQSAGQVCLFLNRRGVQDPLVGCVRADR